MKPRTSLTQVVYISIMHIIIFHICLLKLVLKHYILVTKFIHINLYAACTMRYIDYLTVVRMYALSC